MSPKPIHAKHSGAERGAEGLDSILLIRLVVAAVILAVALLVGKLPVAVRVILLLLSAVCAGYDVALEAVDAVVEGDYFATPLLILFVAVIAFVIGYAGEAAALVLLYRIGLLAISFVEKRCRAWAMDLIRNEEEDTVNRMEEILKDEDAEKLGFAKTAQNSASLVLKVLMGAALVYAIVLPLISGFSFKVSIHRALMMLLICIPTSVFAAMPLTALVGLAYSAKNRVLFRKAAAMERAAATNLVYFDKAGVFAEEAPRVLSMQSDLLDKETFVNFASHAAYYSEQPFAKAIAALNDQDFRLDVISDFEEVPGYGVTLKIANSPVVLATKEYFDDRGVVVPAADDEGIVYYLMVANRYVGKIVLSSVVNGDVHGLVTGIHNIGISRTVLLTEDSAAESQQIADELGIGEVYGECDLEKKLKLIRSANEGTRNNVLYVYANGIEAHSAADVDIRVSQKAKFADASVLPEDMDYVPTALLVCRRMCEVAKENALGAFIIKGILLFLAMTGCASIWFIGFMEIAATIGTMLNAIRVTRDSLLNKR